MDSGNPIIEGILALFLLLWLFYQL